MYSKYGTTAKTGKKDKLNASTWHAAAQAITEHLRASQTGIERWMLCSINWLHAVDDNVKMQSPRRGKTLVANLRVNVHIHRLMIVQRNAGDGTNCPSWLSLTPKANLLSHLF